MNSALPMSNHLLLSLLAASLLVSASNSTAQKAVATEAERAIVRSQASLLDARGLMNKALEKKRVKDLKGAYLDAYQAITMAPSGNASAQLRPGLVTDYTSIALAYAKSLAQDGVFSDQIAVRNGILSPEGTPLSAESVTKSILDPEVNPTCKAAVSLLSDLEQPEVFNKTVTPKFAAQRDEVTRLLREAGQLEQSGRHDLARKQYEAAILIDPYNTAARKGMEAIDNAVLKYGDEAYNETRSRLLWQVEKAWERPPRKGKQGRSTESVGRQQDTRGTDEIVAKLNSIIIPKIDLNDSPVSEAIEYLKQKSAEQSPDKKGVNIFLKLGSSTSAAPAAGLPGAASLPGAATIQPAAPSGEPHVTLSLSHVPLYVALDYLSKLSNLKLKIDPYAVSIVPLSEPTDILITKEYKVPPSFIPQKLNDTNASIPMPGAGPSAENAPRVAAKYNAKDYLQLQGVQFPDGASANYIPMGSKLVVRNTRDNIDLIDGLVDAAMGESPTQVSIETKFLEINQNNLQELGFDWLLGPFSIGGGTYGSGGGDKSSYNSDVYPFGSTGNNPVGSLRSGSEAITGNSVDALLAAQSAGIFASTDASQRLNNTPAPGIFSVAGVFTDPQFQLVIRALNQKKGIDLMSAPKVTTKSGVQATVKIVNEFKYPGAYDPPQIPQSTGQNGVNIGAGALSPQNQPPPTVTPAFPRDFKTENLGVVLVAKPTIGPDGYTIDMELNPKVTDFDGFINYGSPINAVGYRPSTTYGPAVQEPYAQTLTTNKIKQPVFTVREVNTYVTVWDGQTVALGGLIREDIQKVQDKVPILGDVPWAGRLFRSDADQKIKKNLVIFVTPRILDADGQPRRGDTEEPEIVTPLGLPKDLPQPQQTKLGK